MYQEVITIKKVIACLIIILNICSLTGCEWFDVNSDISNTVSSESQNASTVVPQDSSKVESVSGTNSTQKTPQQSSSSKVNGSSSTTNSSSSKVNSSSSTVNSSASSSKDVTSYTEAELLEINKLRPDYDFGTCRKLEGTVSLILFFMDDFESSWTLDEMDEFINKETIPALDFIEAQAKRYGINLKLQIERTHFMVGYGGEVVTDVNEDALASVDVLKQAAKSIQYNTAEEMIADYKRMIKTEIVCMTIFNKKGNAYAINPPRDSDMNYEEHCIIFSKDLNSNGDEPVGSKSSIVAHELLHLFGAEDYYTPFPRKKLARKYCPNDIMLSQENDLQLNDISEATAFYVGWTNKIPWYLKNYDW